MAGRNKRAFEEQFDNNQELEMALRFKGKDKQTNIFKNIMSDGTEHIVMCQLEKLGLCLAVLCTERALGKVPFSVLLNDHVITYNDLGVVAGLI